MPGPNARGATEPTSDGGVATANRLSRGLQAAGAVLGSALALGPTPALADGLLSLSHLGSTDPSALIAPPIAREAKAPACPPGTVRIALMGSATVATEKPSHYSFIAQDCPPAPGHAQTVLSNVTLKEFDQGGAHPHHWLVKRLTSGQTVRKGFDEIVPRGSHSMRLTGEAVSNTGRLLGTNALKIQATDASSNPPAGTAQPGIRLLSVSPAGGLDNVKLGDPPVTLKVEVVSPTTFKGGVLQEGNNNGGCEADVPVAMDKGVPEDFSVTVGATIRNLGNSGDGVVAVNLLGPLTNSTVLPRANLAHTDIPVNIIPGQIGPDVPNKDDCGIVPIN